MSKPIANVSLVGTTFQTWLDRTNQLAHSISTEVVTANSTLGVTTGNAYVNGTLSSETIATKTLRGGNNSIANTLTVSSNASFSSHVLVSNTLTVIGITNVGALTANTLTVDTSIAVSNTVTVNSSTITVGNSSSNAKLTANSISVGNVFMNTTTIVVGATVINSETMGESSNNSNYLDEHTWEEPKEIGTIGPNTAIFTSITAEKLIANSVQGTTGQILKANSSGGIFWSVGGEGYTGSQGVIGYSGSAITGFTGSTGANGSAGTNGYTGSRGADGTPGADGYTGSNGADGTPGGRGYSGSRGDLGYTGSGGNALNGYTGSQGNPGNPGSTGFVGSRGFTGSVGFTGSAGSFGGTVTADLNFGGTYNATQVKSVGVGTSASGSSGEIRASGNITAFYSDERLKDKLGNITDALVKLKTLNGFYFRPNSIAKSMGYDDVIEVGVSAQEVQKVLSEIVVPAPIDGDYLTVRYEKLVALIIEAVKELALEVEDLKDAIR